MSLLDMSRIGNNLLALGVILAIVFMIYSKMDQAKVRNVINRLKEFFGGNKE